MVDASMRTLGIHCNTEEDLRQHALADATRYRICSDRLKDWVAACCSRTDLVGIVTKAADAAPSTSPDRHVELPLRQSEDKKAGPEGDRHRQKPGLVLQVI